MPIDYSKICTSYLSTTSLYTCSDIAGNVYGTFSCAPFTNTNYPAEVVYNSSGLYLSYPTLFCGNRRPIAPDVLARGSLEWNGRIEYGTDNCVQAGRASFTQISADDKTWDLFWMGGGGYGLEMMTTQFQCTLVKPDCSELELEVEGLPITKPLDQATSCNDQFDIPFGNYTGNVQRAFTDATIPVQLQYNSRGMTLSYPTLQCGNRLPIFPTVAAAGALEWNERIEYGMDNCPLGGRVSFTNVADDEWELFWIGSGSTPSGSASVRLTQPLCGPGMEIFDADSTGTPGTEDVVVVQQEEEEYPHPDDIVDPPPPESTTTTTTTPWATVATTVTTGTAAPTTFPPLTTVTPPLTTVTTAAPVATAAPTTAVPLATAAPVNYFTAPPVTSPAPITPAPTPPPSRDPNCQDTNGISYGTFQGMLSQSDNGNSYEVVVNYASTGMTVDYPAWSCGNAQPLLPTVHQNGSILQWREVLDYGQVICDGGGEVTMTKVSDTQWDFSWAGSGVGNGVSIFGILDFEPSCINLV